jgi:acyl transferase domain-containing protein
MVAVSGAFHTSRMDPAAEALKKVMAEARGCGTAFAVLA